MYSQCPDCQTRFRVTAEVLRSAHGTVRCGRCGGAFDALERLSDSIPPAAPDLVPIGLVGASSAVAVPDSNLGTEYHFSAEDLERVFVDAGDWKATFAARAPRSVEAIESAGDAAETPIVVEEQSPGMEDITLEGERIRIEALPDDVADEVDLDSTNELEILGQVPDSAYPEHDEDTGGEIEALPREVLAAAGSAPSLHSETETVADGPAVAGLPAEPEPVAAASVAESLVASKVTEDNLPLSAQRWRRSTDDYQTAPAPATSAWGALAWTLASLLLAVALLSQVVHHYRQDLARHPQIGPPLRIAYERLGFALQPNWNLTAFELRQWGNDADAAALGRMAVRASLTNRASFAQPHPILRLELEDRFGNTVATRDFEPAEYLKNPSQAPRLIAPGASSEAELLLAETGPEAVGYRLDVCLRESTTHLRCASGPG